MATQAQLADLAKKQAVAQAREKALLGEGLTMTTFEVKTVMVGVGGFKTPKTVKVIKSQDWLPMPQEIEVAYPKNWATKNGFMGEFDSSGFWSGTGSAALGGLEGLARVGKATVDMLPGAENLAVEGSYQTGLTVNERKKLIFEGLDFRTFSFSLLLQPNNAGEQGAMEAWIRRVKFDSAPDVQANGGLFIYPDYFVFEWEKMNNLFKTGPCAITNISVNYTPDGIWSENVDAKPTAMRVNLAISEIEIATKEKIGAGW